MKYGNFNDKNREYIINEPLTPNPWINYLGTNGYFGLISNTGGGYTFYQDAKLRRLTRYRYNNVPTDFGGRYYYINDQGTIWNPGFLPMKTALDHYVCRHGMGYTVIEGQKNDVTAEVTYFVPRHDNVEIHVLKLSNQSQNNKTLTVFGMVEWALWDAVDDQTNFQRNLNIAEVEVEKQTIYHKTEYRERRNHYAFYHVNQETKGFDTDRQAFLGAYRGWHEPQVVMAQKSNNSVAAGGSPIASHELRIDLKPGESKTYIFLLGYAENKDQEKFVAPNVMNKQIAKQLIQKYQTVEQVEEAFQQLKDFWEQTLTTYHLSSDHPTLNRMVNIWHQYQCMTTFNMSRSASYFESGTGRGMGFRDSCQDILGFVHMIPERSRERILDLASVQFKDGSTYHQYQPLTKKGNADIGSGFNDDPLWLIAATDAYIRETGDYGILNERVAFNHKKGSEASLFHHLKASIDFTQQHLGPHGLPLIGHADWNDCLNLNCFSKEPGESFQIVSHKKAGIAESIFIASMYVLYGEAFAILADHVGEHHTANDTRKSVEKMRQNVIEHGWDGHWFRRAYDSFGQPVGSHLNEEGKIFVEPQGFCAIAQIGHDKQYDKKALEAVDQYLKNDYGVELLYPSYTSYHLELGEISSYPPGNKENGSVFCHNNPWVVIGYTKTKQPEKAFELYTLNAPAFIEDKSEIHKTEPYVYSQTIAGRSAVNYGEAKNSWLTGTASWTFVAISQHILGVRPHYDGLQIKPCLSKQFSTVKIERKFRGKSFYITIINDKQQKQHLVVNDQAIDGDIVTIDPDVDDYYVTCYA